MSVSAPNNQFRSITTSRSSHLRWPTKTSDKALIFRIATVAGKQYGGKPWVLIWPNSFPLVAFKSLCVILTKLQFPDSGTSRVSWSSWILTNQGFTTHWLDSAMPCLFDVDSWRISGLEMQISPGPHTTGTNLPYFLASASVYISSVLSVFLLWSSALEYFAVDSASSLLTISCHYSRILIGN